MESFWKDVRYGMRVLAKGRGFTAAAIIALILGIGANTAIFSVVNSVLLQPLPLPEPERLMRLSETSPKFPDEMSVSYLNFVDWREQNQTFEDMAAFRQDGFNLSTGELTERVFGHYVSGNFFKVLGVGPSQGRGFTTEDDRPGAAPVVVLSYGLWQRQFGGDPDLVGRAITLDSRPVTVAGILPREFWFLSQMDLYIPFAHTDEMIVNTREMRAGTRVVGRLKPGVTLELARSDLERVMAGLVAEYPVANPGHGVVLDSIHESLVGGVRPHLIVLLAAVGFVLLIACVNVANLLLARSTARQKEIAIRVALGASRWRIIRQLLSESLLLALVGGTLGLLIALWGVDSLASFVSDAVPRAGEIRVDGRVLAFTFSLCMLTGVVFGLVPALQASRPDLNETMKEGGRTTMAGRQRALSLLVVAEVVFALVLLVGAGLMIRSIIALYDTSPGFDPKDVVTMRLALSKGDYSEPEKIRAFYSRLTERMRELPGVEAAALTNDLPFEDDSETPFVIEGRPTPAREDIPWALFYAVSADYMNAMRVPLLRGRFFTELDTKDSTKVAVIDQQMAERFFPGEDPIGKRIIIPMPEADDPLEIIGIVGHVKHFGLVGDAQSKIQAQLYLPFLQMPDPYIGLVSSNLTFVLRTGLDVATISAAMKSRMVEVDRGQPVYDAKTMEQIISRSISQQRMLMLLLGVFASVALLLAAVGLYGVMSYAVEQRTHEIGIRMALGATSGDVMRLVVGRGLGLVLAGIGLGLVAAFAGTRVISSMLYGVSATDPVTFAAIPILLIGVAFIACAVPARRATRVDPVEALRHE
jgi:putative ABC transport system permease protein